MIEQYLDSVTGTFSDEVDLSRARDGWYIENLAPESVAGTIRTLSDVFVEWYLHNSGDVKDINSFLAVEGLTDIISSDDFMALMTGRASMDDMLCSVVLTKVPFEITDDQVHTLNEQIKKNLKYPCVSCLDISAAAQLINNIRINEKKETKLKKYREINHKFYETHREYMCQYHREYYRNKGRQARHEYYMKNRDKISVINKEKYDPEKQRIQNSMNYQRYTQQKARAQEMCPAFMFLTQLRSASYQLYLTQYQPRENIVNKAWKTCGALNENNWRLCPLVNGDLQDATVRAQCPMPRVFEFDMAVSKIQEFIAQLKQSEWTK